MTQPQNELSALDTTFIKDVLQRIAEYENDTAGRKPAMGDLMRTLKELGIFPEPTIKERVDALDSCKQQMLGDFNYEHLANEDLKKTSKIFYKAMLEFLESYRHTMPEPQRIDEVTNKLWEAKNLAVLLAVKGHK